MAEKIRAAGFTIEPRRVVAKTISGSAAAALGRGFARLLDSLEPGDVLVVTKLGRLGRNAMDLGSTVAKLAGIGVRVHGLALGYVDLTGSTGKLTMGVVSAVAEFERDLLIERPHMGLSRAKAEGKRLGRPASLTAEQRAAVAQRLAEGASVCALARDFKTSRQTILRMRARGRLRRVRSATAACAAGARRISPGKERHSSLKVTERQRRRRSGCKMIK